MKLSIHARDRFWLALTIVMFLGICVQLAGCASIGLQPAKSLDERIAYASGTINAIQSTVAGQKERGAISRDDATRALNTLDQAHGLTIAARLASGAGDVTTAEGRLTAALSILTELQAWLNERAAP